MTFRRLAVPIFLAGLASLGRGQALLGTLSGSVVFDNVGQNVAMMGDLDGDGRDDLALGSGGGALEPGVVKLLSGANLSTQHVFTGAQNNDKASVVARLGDLDGDGRSELAIGAWGDDTGGNERGSVKVHSGATGALLHTLQGSFSGARFGWSVSGAGDVDGDGKEDILVGAPGNGMPARVQLYSTATWTLLVEIPGDGNSAGLGRSVASIGDVDGDGLRDIVTGCEDSNRVFVWSSADGTALLQINGPPDAKLGTTVAAVGDANGDGHEDLAAGGPEYDTFGLPSAGGNAGLVQIHSGTDGAVIASIVGTELDEFGRKLAAAGDVDADGTPDVAVAAPKVEIATLLRGAVSVHSADDGKRLGELRGDIDASGFGSGLSGGGDLDGDGYPDLAIGSPGDDAPVIDAGQLTCASFRLRIHDAYPDHLLFTQPGNVALFGGGFGPGSPITITLEGVPATNVQWVSDGLVTFDAPVGVEDSLADLVYTQDGQSVVVPDAFVYEGARIVEPTPDQSVLPGNVPVTLWGEHFVDDGSNVVWFGGATATITNVDAPNRIDVLTPVFTPVVPNPGWQVRLICSNGTADIVNGFSWLTQYASPNRGNITGGTPVTLFAVPGHLFENVSVSMGVSGPFGQVVSVTAKQINLITPAVPEPIDQEYPFFVHDPVGGSVSIANQFFYTPWLGATFEPNPFHGGTLSLRWITDPSVTTTQLITLWLATPLSAPVSKTLAGYAGILRALPDVFVFLGLPEPGQPQLLELHVPPLDPQLAGLELRFQSLVSGEGGPKGSFTNVVEVVLP